ncbi:uncharacterized protein LOC141676810 isoform X2 [Apium graveolens]|uniref:uncharacterized protein LOC141676810 isoform X2 n=1 Tax=Apium graveolens TaxID=4045 RepID=UPI003D7BAA3F
MEHFIIITVIICIASSVLFTPCDSLSGTHAGSDNSHHLTHPAVLPRKLRPRKGHEVSINKDYNGGHQDMAKQDAFSGKEPKNGAKKRQASIETWREWMEAEGSDTSQYFTMDYSRVRRRRPIHNKSLPVAP